MKKIVVLGAGMVGSAMAADLSINHNVKLVDIDFERLSSLKRNLKIEIQAADLSKASDIKKVIDGCDIVIGAVPGFMGFNTLKTVIENGKNVVDISFFDEDPFELDKLAKKKNVTAVVDCGVAPGMSCIILGYYNKIMEINSFECLVGGLPKERKFPFQYKAPFSPIDVIEEYTRPARYVENGNIIIKPALTDPELVDFPKVGTLESFNTDGLRTLLTTIKIPNMIEKTLRYPGHIEYIRVLKDSGFFNKDLVEIKDGIKVRPIDVTSKLLFPLWKLKEDEREFTVMRIKISGKEKNKNKTYVYNLYDEFDPLTKTSSMARTTGYTCTAAANLVLNGVYKRKGISPPEFLGEDENCFKGILSYLEKRNVNYNVENVKE